jgi:hypothetical protein
MTYHSRKLARNNCALRLSWAAIGRLTGQRLFHPSQSVAPRPTAPALKIAYCPDTDAGTFSELLLGEPSGKPTLPKLVTKLAV